MGNLTLIAKAFFFVSLGILLLVLSYLSFINPELNYFKKSKMETEREIQSKAQAKELTEWKYDYFSDVDVGKDEQRYPIVVLRSGFKVIKTDQNGALIGWVYEVANTSPENAYQVNVEYSITDSDSFGVATDEAKEHVPAQKTRVIRETVYVDSSDVSRLSNSNWTIWLDKNWQNLEKETELDRYGRLKKIMPEYPPKWVSDNIENSIWPLSEKLNALITKYSSKAGTEDQVNEPAKEGKK